MQTITSTELAKRFVTDFPGIRFEGPRDGSYFLASSEWLVEFTARIKSILPAYRAEMFDCEDAARRMVDRACDALLAARESTPAGHALFEADVIVGSNGPFEKIPEGEYEHKMHTLVLAATQEGWWVADPQIGLARPLVDCPGVVFWRRVRL